MNIFVSILLTYLIFDISKWVEAFSLNTHRQMFIFNISYDIHIHERDYIIYSGGD